MRAGRLCLGRKAHSTPEQKLPITVTPRHAAPTPSSGVAEGWFVEASWAVLHQETSSQTPGVACRGPERLSVWWPLPLLPTVRFQVIWSFIP